MGTNTDTNTINTFDTCLVTATNGFVWVCKTARQDEHFMHLVNARIVRAWGTTEGLAQLYEGPRSETVLDRKTPIVSVAWHAVISIMPVNSMAWESSL